MRDAVRVRGYSLRTEEAYVEWARRFVLFHGRQHPDSLGMEAVEGFLTHLAVERHVAPSTQNQAKAALLFLYKGQSQQTCAVGPNAVQSGEHTSR